MSVVIADTGPLHYLVLIEAVKLLPTLFGAVLVPEAVRAELDHAETPTVVRRRSLRAGSGFWRHGHTGRS